MSWPEKLRRVMFVRVRGNYLWDIVGAVLFFLAVLPLLWGKRVRMGVVVAACLCRFLPVLDGGIRKAYPKYDPTGDPELEAGERYWRRELLIRFLWLIPVLLWVLL